MILGIKNVDVEGHRYKDEPVSGLDLNINFSDVRVDGENVEVSFAYTVSYKEGVGMLKVNGIAYTKEDAKTAKAVEAGWKEQKLPAEFAQQLINAINYASGAEGTFIARTLNLAPPLVPPRVNVSQSAPKAPKGKG